MRIVNLLAVIDKEKCTGCRTCIRVCPTLAIKLENKKAEINNEQCVGCQNCEQRCPFDAIHMQDRQPFTIGVEVKDSDYDKIEEICKKAKFNPEQIICYCTGTRAEEVAQAIIEGAKTPEEITQRTGARSGCKVECIQPILRLLKAAGIEPEPPKDGWQWYGTTVTAWEIPESIRNKYSNVGFYFDEDLELLNRIASSPTSKSKKKDSDNK
ncbi:(Fe-S)-binding protein [Thermoanaerobacterium thermosaccharolyticum]|uniref:(Fe-S)-binding protein n=1 Tax=Thermoanaerobacterium thermosaccharolyticum TaxID=1517 RepID=A0A231VCE0_THETR|nr:(2Fe-2S)-binding protein [Thermoanaerobacterium thermosaccharolyticum]OXT05854.1 (Fe-S)-binding protein [Thermoanaerobacterium thermosaccharolyticum]